MNLKDLKSVEFPKYYLHFIERYLSLGLYPSFNAFFKKALENQIRQEEILLSDLQISKCFNAIDTLKSQCAQCNHCNIIECKECITEINNSIDVSLVEISNLSEFIEKKRQEQQQVSRNHIRNINHAIRQMQRIKGG